MLAKVKATGEIIEVYEHYNDYNGETSFIELHGEYQAEELDCNIPAPEKAVIEGWVARDRNGDLSLYRTYPERQEKLGYWRDGDGESELPKGSFPSITWESEPCKARIEIILING